MKYSPELVSEERKENIYKHAKRKDRHSCSQKCINSFLLLLQNYFGCLFC